MKRILLLAPILLALASQVSGQIETPQLKIRAILVDKDLNQKPVPRLMLTLQRLDGVPGPETILKTGFDGMAEAKLPPGKYRLSTPRPIEFQGKRYAWETELTLSGLEYTLELSNDNAKISEAPGEQPARTMDDLAALFKRLQNSVVTVWSESGHGTGFFVDAKGLVLTNQHVVSSSEYRAVQFDERRKVTAKLLAADPQKDIAVLWADLSAFPEVIVASVAKPEGGQAPVIEGERVFTIGSPLHQRKILTTGVVSKVEPRAIISDININPGSSGGPLFSSIGHVVGITTFGEKEAAGPGISGIVRIEEALPLLEQARTNMAGTPPPAPALLPVEPKDRYPLDAIKVVLRAEKFDKTPYFWTVGDYEIAMYTPLLESWLREERRIKAEREKQKRDKKKGEAAEETSSASEDVKNWGQAVGEYQAVISIRVRPKLREKFWASYSSRLKGGPLKVRFKTDFYKMRLLCSGKELQPIHPGRHRIIGGATATVDITDTAHVGLYDYPPEAIAPSCGQVALEIYPEKNSAQPTVKVLDPVTVERVWGDFEPYRKVQAAPARTPDPAKN